MGPGENNGLPGCAFGPDPPHRILRHTTSPRRPPASTPNKLSTFDPIIRNQFTLGFTHFLGDSLLPEDRAMGPNEASPTESCAVHDTIDDDSAGGSPSTSSDLSSLSDSSVHSEISRAPHTNNSEIESTPTVRERAAPNRLNAEWRDFFRDSL
jgi:hypothetical protein